MRLGAIEARLSSVESRLAAPPRRKTAGELAPGDKLDFEKLRPQFACNEQAVIPLVVSDPVQDIDAGCSVGFTEQPASIQPVT